MIFWNRHLKCFILGKCWGSGTDWFNLHYFLWGNLTRKSNNLKVEPCPGTDCVRSSRFHCTFMAWTRTNLPSSIDDKCVCWICSHCNFCGLNVCLVGKVLNPLSFTLLTRYDCRGNANCPWRHTFTTIYQLQTSSLGLDWRVRHGSKLLSTFISHNPPPIIYAVLM
jgi:hypothetical protein